MSEDHPTDEQPNQPPPDEEHPDEEHPDQEPTQPLAGWQQPRPSAPSGYYGSSATSPMPAHPQPGPAPSPAFGEYRPVAAPARRGLPVGAWLGVAATALVLGLVGGLLGAGLFDLAEQASGRMSSGLDGASTQTAAPLDADNGSVPAVAQAMLPSTVQIIAEYGGKEAGATGSGFVLDREGHVITNNHVVASAAEDEGPITVIGHTGERYQATVVGRSPVYDLAVLLVEDVGNVEPAALGASRSLRVGDPVVAFGSPLGLSQTVTSGIVSALDRPVTTGQAGNDSSYINAVQTDAAINPGNSGGPLVNLRGEVVGVNSAIATTGGVVGESGNIGVGFAIPIEQVRTTVDQILRTGKAQYPVIGAKVRTGGEGVGVGAQITEVMPDTPASSAGLKKNDVVTAVQDQQVTDGISLIVAIRTHRPGEKVEFTVMRGDTEQKFTLTLDGEVG